MATIEVRPAARRLEVVREFRRVSWPGDAPPLLVTATFGVGALGPFAQRHAGKAWMAARIGGNEVWCFFSENSCWRCLAEWLKLRDWRAGWVDRADLQVAAMRLREQLSGSRPAGLRVIGSRVADHPIPRRSQCQVCGDPALLGRMPETFRETASQRVRRAEFGVSGVTGFISEMATYSLGGVHLAEASYVAPRRSTAAASQAVAAGSGTTSLQARTRCLGEAVERYCLAVQGYEKIERLSLRQATEGNCIRELLHPFSDRQYRERTTWNNGEWGFPVIPAKLTRDEVVQWAAVTSLASGEPRLAPAPQVYFGVRQTGESRYASDTIGCAAGRTWEEATRAGLLEWVERDAVAIWWYNRLARPLVENRPMVSPAARPWVRFLEGCGRPFWVLDLTTDLGIPVAAAISTSERGSQVAMGFGCDTGIEAAVAKALRELCQTSKGIEGWRHEDLPKNTIERAFIRWSGQASVAREPHLGPEASARALAHRTSGGEQVPALVSRLHSAGVEPFAIRLWRPEVNWPVVRILCPGLCHPWHRLGIPRLYAAPVRMELIDEPRREEELNPYPFVQ